MEEFATSGIVSLPRLPTAFQLKSTDYVIQKFPAGALDFPPESLRCSNAMLLWTVVA